MLVFDSLPREPLHPAPLTLASIRKPQHRRRFEFLLQGSLGTAHMPLPPFFNVSQPTEASENSGRPKSKVTACTAPGRPRSLWHGSLRINISREMLDSSVCLPWLLCLRRQKETTLNPKP